MKRVSYKNDNSTLRGCSARSLRFARYVRLAVVVGLNNLSVDLGVALVGLVHAELLKKAAGAKEAGAVGRGVVLQAGLKSVAGELLAGGLGHDAVAIDLGVSDLAEHITVREADHETVAGALVPD